jgi:hypothetical protein
VVDPAAEACAHIESRLVLVVAFLDRFTERVERIVRARHSLLRRWQVQALRAFEPVVADRSVRARTQRGTGGKVASVLERGRVRAELRRECER